MQFNHNNNNDGDVNNAISEKGNVVQATGPATTGDVVQSSGIGNKVQVDHAESYWSGLWEKIIACWKWLVG